MPQQPFTAAGAAAKLSELYALSDTLLASEADEVRLNFVSWMETNFTLDTEQADYLETMDEDTIKYLSTEISFCFLYRLPVLLIKPDAPTTSYAKWVATDNEITTQTDGAGGFTPSGSFTVAVVYKTDD